MQQERPDCKELFRKLTSTSAVGSDGGTDTTTNNKDTKLVGSATEAAVKINNADTAE